MPGRLERTLHVHARALIGCSSPCHSFVGVHYMRTVQPLLEELRTHLRHVDAGTRSDAQRPGQGPPRYGLIDALRPGVDMSSASREAPVVVDDAPTGGVGHEADQPRHRLSGSTPDARANRAACVPRGTGPQVYPLSVGPSAVAATGPLPAVPPSGRMSMRQPVSRAASRAFCPSLPMASESW